MTEQEKTNESLQRQIDAQNANFDKAMLKIDMALEEIRQQREDMRRLQDRQDEDRRKHDADMKAAQAKHDADLQEMNKRFYEKFDAMDAKIDSKFDKLSEQLRTMTIAAVVGFGAIVVAIGGLVVSVVSVLK